MDLPTNQIILTKAQKEVVSQLQKGAVIGEYSDKINGRYELFIRKPNRHKTKRLNKNTVFALLTIGLICENNKIAETMSPFHRDKWYGLARMRLKAVETGVSVQEQRQGQKGLFEGMDDAKAPKEGE